jgi:hypothetical protein
MQWDDDEYESALRRVEAGGRLNASGQSITPERLLRLLQAAPLQSEDPGRPMLEFADFSEVTFEGDVSFEWIMFVGGARFDFAIFRGDVDFREAIFEDTGSFYGATFEGEAKFSAAAFKSRAEFSDATFHERTTWFRTVFGDSAAFEGSTFKDDVSFVRSAFEKGVSFARARFVSARDFGPLEVAGQLDLDQIVFAERIRVEACAGAVSCKGTQFRGGAYILIRGAEVTLDDADFGAASTLSPPSGEPKLRSEPRVASMRRALVANLAIAGADMQACRFEGARGIDQLHLERTRFAETPHEWQRTSRFRLPFRFTRRQAIAEEHRWQAEREGYTGWYGPALRPKDDPDFDPPTAEQIAGTYRALRKGREDIKDEPGAADLYYGEMEMRRHATKKRRRKSVDGERVALWFYWLTAGYGLRPSRAFVALGLTLLVAALLLDWWGFRPDRAFGRTLLFSVESCSSLFRAPETKGFSLTAAGEMVQVALRLLGPLFIGLALLSLRGRVKR